MHHPDITSGTKGLKYYKRLDSRNSLSCRLNDFILRPAVNFALIDENGTQPDSFFNIV